MPDDHLLTSKEMARFAADGMLRFDRVVPEDLNRRALEQMKEGIPRAKGGTPVSELWQGTPIGEVFSLPKIRGVMRSLVGPGPYDHHAVHTVSAGHQVGQCYHADAIIDTRMHFDIQFFFYAHDTPREAGGTLFLPGSHFRRISESNIARYQNFAGQPADGLQAGTMAVAHHGIWHCAQPNHTGETRYMFKLRLNPTVRQRRLWDTSDIDDPEILSILNTNHGWYGNEFRLEVVNRIKFWRFLTGNEEFDVSYWLSRLENLPETPVVAAG